MRHQAGFTLSEVAALQQAERHRQATVPTPLTAFACVNLGGIAATVLLGRYHLALYGLPAFATAVWVSARSFARSARESGLQLATRPWAVTAAALCIGGIATSRAGAALNIDAVSAIGPFLGQATGLWLLGRWASSEVLIGAATMMGIASLIIGVLAGGDFAVAVQFGLYGVLLLAAAQRIRQRGRTP